MANILNAIENIILSQEFSTKRSGKGGGSKMNKMGDPLEEYIKDAFANTFSFEEDEKRDSVIDSVFSYCGNSTNPPDSMLIEPLSDAIEVKKIESNSELQLNSSNPKHKLYKDDPRINNECKAIIEKEKGERDIIYVVGLMKDVDIKNLAFVYGLTYCAPKETYHRISDTIKNGVEEIEGVTFAHTKELGRINNIDPLKITNLRVRGMYLIKNPFMVYNIPTNTSNSFDLFALIPIEKYNTFSNGEDFKTFCENTPNAQFEEIDVQDPSNPKDTIKCYKITYYKE